MAAVLIGAACSHALVATGQPSATTGPVVWPAPPSAPRARLAAILPDPHAPRPRRSWWRTVAGWITGQETRERRADELVRPFGVAAEPTGAVVIADPDAGAVFRIHPGGARERLSCPGTEWSAPMGIAVGAPGELFVTDAGLGLVARLADRGCTLLGRGELERPTGVAVAGGRLFVVDPPRHQIVSFALDGSAVSRWGSQGAGQGQFAFPSSIAAAAGSLVVADALNFRVARVGTDGGWISAFGSPGDEGAGFARPKGIAVGADGRVFVSDAQRDVVLVFSPGGDLEFTIGEAGEGPGQFTLPSGLAVAAGRLFVADSQNRRIQVFELLGGTP